MSMPERTDDVGKRKQPRPEIYAVVKRGGQTDAAHKNGVECQELAEAGQRLKAEGAANLNRTAIKMTAAFGTDGRAGRDAFRAVGACHGADGTGGLGRFQQPCAFRRTNGALIDHVEDSPGFFAGIHDSVLHLP
jgi:hypothetical protein